jgi:hypothetical protein
MFSLDDAQLDRLMDAAAMPPTSKRDAFVRSVAGRLAGLPRVSISEIDSAIECVLNSYGIAFGSNAMTHHRRQANYSKGVFK